MKIEADFIPPEDLIVTMVNGQVLTPPVMLKKGQPVHLSARFPGIDLPLVFELEGYRVCPMDRFQHKE